MIIIQWVVGAILATSVCVGKGDDSTLLNAATVRTAMRFAVETPFHNIALNTIPDGLSTRQSIVHILNQKGILGFYSGSPFEIIRSALWYPRMHLMKEPWKVCVPLGSIESIQDVNSIRIDVNINFVECDPHVSTATNLAVFEIVEMPLLRVRNAFMLHSFQSILDKVSHIGQTLYTGSILRGGSTFISWYTFFKAQEYAKERWENSPLSQGALTTATQMVVGSVTAPLYIVMVNRQKLVNPCGLPFWKSAWKTYLNQGAQVFVRTAKFGAAHAGIQSALTLGVLNLFGED